MRRGFFGVGLASLLLACNRAPSNLMLEKVAVSTDAVDVTLHWTTKDYADVVPKNGTVTVVVKDLVPTANVFDDEKNEKEVCRAESPVSAGTAAPDKKRLELHVAAKCPPIRPNVTRNVAVTFVGKDGKSLMAGTQVQRGDRPKGPPPPDVRVTFKKGIAAMPESKPLMADKPCPVNRIYGVDRKDRDWLQNRLYSWDDAARLLGVPGAGSLCPNALGDPSEELTQQHALAAVIRMDTCVPPKVNVANSTFTRGSATGLLAIVDLRDGEVLCYGRMSAKTSDTVKVPADSNDPDAWIRGNFNGSIREAAFARMRTLSKYLGLPKGQPDPL